MDQILDLMHGGDGPHVSARKIIEETDVLVIDEISMLSTRVFEMIEEVIRRIKDSPYLFGGIQVSWMCYPY